MSASPCGRFCVIYATDSPGWLFHELGASVRVHTTGSAHGPANVLCSWRDSQTFALADAQGRVCEYDRSAHGLLHKHGLSCRSTTTARSAFRDGNTIRAHEPHGKLAGMVYTHFQLVLLTAGAELHVLATSAEPALQVSAQVSDHACDTSSRLYPPKGGSSSRSLALHRQPTGAAGAWPGAME